MLIQPKASANNFFESLPPAVRAVIRNGPGEGRGSEAVSQIKQGMRETYKSEIRRNPEADGRLTAILNSGFTQEAHQGDWPTPWTKALNELKLCLKYESLLEMAMWSGTLHSFRRS